MTGDKSLMSKQKKVSRIKLLKDRALAEARYYEAKTRYDSLHNCKRGLTHEQAQDRAERARASLRQAEINFDRAQCRFDSSQPNTTDNMHEEARVARDNAVSSLKYFNSLVEALSPQGDILREEARVALEEAAVLFQSAFEAALPPPSNNRQTKRLRVIGPRDLYPVDFDRFERWLSYRVKEFDEYREGEQIGLNEPNVGINPEIFMEKLKVPIENIQVWLLAVDDRKYRNDELYPTNAQKRLCMNYCTNHLGYYEPGLGAMSHLVQYLFVFMDQHGVSNDDLARMTCLSRRTIEAWAGTEPSRNPRLQDVLACFQALGMPLAPVSYEADRAFQNEAGDAAVKINPDADWDLRSAPSSGPK